MEPRFYNHWTNNIPDLTINILCPEKIIYKSGVCLQWYPDLNHDFAVPFPLRFHCTALKSEPLNNTPLEPRSKGRDMNFNKKRPVAYRAVSDCSIHFIKVILTLLLLLSFVLNLLLKTPGRATLLFFSQLTETTWGSLMWIISLWIKG